MVNCGSTQYMQGWCSSGNHADCCGGSCFHELTCCSDYSISRNNCYAKYGSSGQFLTCSAGSAIVGACGSGSNADCSGRFFDEMYEETGVMAEEEKKGSYTIAYCCDIGNLKLAPYGDWKTGGCGYTVSCRPNQLMTGLCGSGGIGGGSCSPVPNLRQERIEAEEADTRGCSASGVYTGIQCTDVL